MVSKASRGESNSPLKRPFWPSCPADKFNGKGNSGTVMRTDIAQFYNDFYKEVHDLGGIVTSSGGRRLLTGKASPNRSKKSFHYVGRAFDLNLDSGMQDPETDPYVIQQDLQANRCWNVWCRSTLDVDSLLKKIYGSKISGGKMTIEGWYMEGRTPMVKEVNGIFFSLTDVALKHGFKRIQARRSFFKAGNLQGAEWWHFQNDVGLVKGKTTFGSDLRRTYSLRECQKFAYWGEVHNSVYGEDWF